MNCDLVAHAAHRERQKIIAEALGQPGAAAGDVLHELIDGLGLPRSLSAVGVGPDQFDVVAKNSLHDRWLHTNPRKVNGLDDVMTLLNMAA